MGGGNVSIFPLFRRIQRGNWSSNTQEANVLLLGTSCNRESKGRLLSPNCGSYLTASAFSLPGDHAPFGEEGGLGSKVLRLPERLDASSASA